MGFVGGSEGDILATQMQNDIANSRSPRVIISSMHFYLERVLYRLIQEFVENSSELLERDERGYFPSYWDKTKILHDNNIFDDLIFQELGIINEIRNEFIHTFEPDDEKITELCDFLLFHPYNERRTNIDKASYDALEVMSELCEILDRRNLT